MYKIQNTKYFICIVCLIFATVANAQEPEHYKILSENNGFYYHFYPTGGNVVPEQSLESIAYAKALGFSIVEANINQCKNGVYVVRHGYVGTLYKGLAFREGSGINENTLFSDITSDQLRENVSYVSPLEQYRTAIPTLEEYLAECKRLGMTVFLQIKDAEVLDIARRYLPDEKIIAYGLSKRGDFKGIITTWQTITEETDVKAICQRYGSPYLLGCFGLDKLSDEKIKEICDIVHENDCRIANAYVTGETTRRQRKLGIDAFASTMGDVSVFDTGNCQNLYSLSEWVTSNEVNRNEDGSYNISKGTILTLNDKRFVNRLGKCCVKVKFNGTITLNIGGHANTISSDGSEMVELAHEVSLKSLVVKMVAEEDVVLSSIRIASSIVTNPHDLEDNGIYYTIDDTDKFALSVSHKGDYPFSFANEYADTVMIPENVSNGEVGYVVSKVGERAFEGCEDIKHVEIPSSVTQIGDFAFNGCGKLVSLKLQNTAPPLLGASVFNDCDQLKTIYIPEGTLEAYQTLPWNSFKLVEVTGDVSLIDGEVFDNPSMKVASKIVYTRNFNNLNWQPWYVPFEVDYDDISEDFVVAKINDVNQFDDDDDGVFERWALEVLRLKSGAVVQANLPYMVKAKKTGEQSIVVENTTLYAAEKNTIDCSSTAMTYTFQGSYSPLAGSELAANGCYVMSGGKLVIPSQTTTLKPFRWYLLPEMRGGYAAYYAPKEILVFERDEDETSIEGIHDEETFLNWPADVYNLNGQLVKKNAMGLNGIPKGVYIVNGIKIMK